VREVAMIYVGIDDTDTLDDPGTNQLARHLVRELSDQFRGRIIVRHQLLEDPRVPCTRKNGCASIQFEPKRPATLEQLTDPVRDIMLQWCPRGSDPGLCVTSEIPIPVVEWGLRCKRELVSQAEAHQLAAQFDIYLEGLGGTEDGVIGALAAVGLMATGDDGRVVHFGFGSEDWYDVTGCLDVADIRSRGVDEIRTIDSGEPVTSGTIDVGKRLRPNYRQGKVVLYVARIDAPHWEAVRVT
jgi:hypothetical protein